MSGNVSSGARSGVPPRVAFVSGSPRTLLGARSSLIRALVAQGSPVLCAAPNFSTEQASQLLVLGAEQATFELTPKGPQLLADWNVKRELVQLFRNWEPDVVIAMTERVMALALLAARRAHVRRRVALFNGFVARGGRGSDADVDPFRASPRLLARALKAADSAVFHNRDDLREVMDAGALPRDLPHTILPGAGVDLAAFPAVPLPPVADGAVFLMVSALDEAKGVIDYCEVARRLKERAPRAEFLLAGPAADGATAISANVLRPYSEAVTFLGALADVRPALARSHVFVYPSHGEGMPRAVMEALAVGRPVITTSTPGCRETVDDCVNGMLVLAGNVPALEDAMARMLKRPDQLPSMARASRLKAERHFDERRVLSKWLELLGLEVSLPSAISRAA
ncbi:MAG: glycosyltransferase [Hyphomicrobiaceae bacterium]